MRIFRAPLSGNAVAAACGAGLAAALLTIVSARHANAAFVGSGAGPLVAALVMGFISPLAIMIAAIGFGTLAGALAALVGCLAIAAFGLMPDGHAALQLDKLGPATLQAFAFLLSQGIPALVLGRVAVMGAPRSGTGAVGAGRTFTPKTLGPPVRPEERVLGLVASIAIGFASLSIMFALLIEVETNGGFAAFMTSLVTKGEPVIQSLIAPNKSLFKDVDVHLLTLSALWGLMPFLAARAVVIFLFNLWLAARISQTSGLLPVQWPDIPSNLRLPRPLALVLAVALGLSLAGGLFGMLSLIVSGALVMGFVLQGLAVIHALTRGMKLRTPLLVTLYLSALLLFPWPLLVFGLFGLLDAAFAFRDRQNPIVKKIKP